MNYTREDFSFLDVSNETDFLHDAAAYSSTISTNSTVNDNFYSTINELNQDMLQHQSSEKEYHEFMLSPNTVFEIINEKNSTKLMNEESALMPTLSNTLIKCGEDGSSASNCVLSGGLYHVIFHPDVLIQNVTIQGLTFTQNEAGVSVGAWANALSSVYFVDCIWKDNENSYNLIEMSHDNPDTVRFLRENNYDKRNLLESSRPAMNLGFYNCLFERNQVEMGLIINTGGILELSDTIFQYNSARVFIIGIIFDSYLYMRQSVFKNNQAGYYTLFIDSEAQYNLEETTNSIDSYDNTASMCANGMFIQDKSSKCLQGGKDRNCFGTCCFFEEPSSNSSEFLWSDQAKDCFYYQQNNAPDSKTIHTLLPKQPDSSIVQQNLYQNSETAAETEQLSGLTGGLPSAIHLCDTTCITIAVLIPVLTFIISITAFFLLERKSRKKNRYTDEYY